MGSIERRPHTGTEEPANRTAWQKFGSAFQARLDSEHVRFLTLSALLARAGEDETGIFDDLSFQAHRLHGLAAMFEFAELAAAARLLDHACTAAVDCNADRTDETVWAALLGLVDLLGAIRGDRQAQTADPAPPLASQSL